MKKLFILLFLFILVGSNSSSGQTITGTLNVCAGSAITPVGSPVGGTWSTSTTTIATVNAMTGVVSGISAGTTTITYTTGTGVATAVVTVNLTPTGILGSTAIACGSSSTLSGTPSGGLWSVTTPW